MEEVGVTEAEEEAAEGALVEDKEVVEIEARQMEDSNNQDIVSSIFCYWEGVYSVWSVSIDAYSDKCIFITITGNVCVANRYYYTILVKIHSIQHIHSVKVLLGPFTDCQDSFLLLS